jgi:hypothetical protein
MLNLKMLAEQKLLDQPVTSLKLLLKTQARLTLKCLHQKFEKFLIHAWASVGEVSNEENRLVKYWKSRTQPLAWNPPNSSRYSYEPGRPSIWWW